MARTRASSDNFGKYSVDLDQARKASNWSEYILFEKRNFDTVLVLMK